MHRAMKLLMAMVICPALVRAEFSDTPKEDVWMTNGEVKAIARSGSTTYIGGSFTRVGRWTGAGVPVDSVSGAIVSPFPKVGLPVFSAVPERNSIINAVASPWVAYPAITLLL